MKYKTRLAISLALLPALLLPGSCRRMDYDISKGIDKEITLFEEEVTIPLGSTGEITLEKIVSEANGFLQQAGLEFKTDKDGLLYTEIEDYFGYVDAYSILYQIKDLTQPYDYALKNLNGSVGGTQKSYNAFLEHLNSFMRSTSFKEEFSVALNVNIQIKKSFDKTSRLIKISLYMCCNRHNTCS